MAMIVSGSAWARGTGEKTAKMIIIKAMIQTRFFMASSMNHLKKEPQSEKIHFGHGPLG
jgi:hypothetical protein